MNNSAVDSLQTTIVHVEAPLAVPIMADEVMTGEAKPAEPKVVVKKPVSQTKAKPSSTLTHADSVFFAPVARDFETLCKDGGQYRAEVSETYSWQKSETATEGTVESVGMGTSVMVAEPLGHSLLSPYRTVALTTVALSMLLVLIVKASRSSVLSEVFSFLTDYTAWKRLMLSTSLFGMFSLRMLNIVYYVVFAAFCVESFLVLMPEGHKYLPAGLVLTTVAVAGVVMVFYNVRYLADRMIGYAFHQEERVKAVSLCKAGAVSLMGLCLLPIVALLPFLPIGAVNVLIVVALGLIVLLTILRVYHTIRINLNNIGSFFYLLLYLCIVEVTPLVCLFYIAKGI